MLRVTSAGHGNHYLFVDTLPAVVFSGTGVLARVPAPERYAAHKLIVARKRPPGDRTKRAKDRAPAASLLGRFDIVVFGIILIGLLSVITDYIWQLIIARKLLHWHRGIDAVEE